MLFRSGTCSTTSDSSREKLGTRWNASLPDSEEGSGAPDNLLNLILECTGQKKKDKEAKVTTAQTLWIPAVNGHGEFGRWAFLEISDPWDSKNAIKKKLFKPRLISNQTQNK